MLTWNRFLHLNINTWYVMIVCNILIKLLYQKRQNFTFCEQFLINILRKQLKMTIFSSEIFPSREYLKYIFFKIYIWNKKYVKTPKYSFEILVWKNGHSKLPTFGLFLVKFWTREQVFFYHDFSTPLLPWCVNSWKRKQSV